MTEEELLKKYGFSSATHTIDRATGKIVPRASPIARAITARDPSSIEVAATSAIDAVPETLGFIPGFTAGVGAWGPAAFASPWTAAGALLTGVGGGLATSGAVGWLKNKIQPDAWTQRIAENRELRPTADFVGRLGAQALTAKPSLQSIRNIARGIGSVGDKVNVAAGAGLGAGTSIIDDLASDRDVDFSRALMGGVGGAIFNDPTKLAGKLSVGRYKISPASAAGDDEFSVDDLARIMSEDPPTFISKDVPIDEKPTVKIVGDEKPADVVEAEKLGAEVKEALKKNKESSAPVSESDAAAAGTGQPTWADPLAGTPDRLRALNLPTFNRVADGFTRLEAKRRNMRGHYSNKLFTEMGKYSDKARRAVYNVLLEENHLGTSLRSRILPRLQPLYDEMRRTYKEIRVDQIKAGHYEGDTPPGVDPTGMFHQISDEAQQILMEKQGTLEYNRLRDDFVKYNTSRFINNGMNSGEAKKLAEESFTRFQGSLSTSSPGENLVSFKALTLPENTHLPASMIEKDPQLAWQKYLDKATKARAFHDVVRTDPALMAAFGVGQVPGVDNVYLHPLVQAGLDSYANGFGATQQPLPGALARLVSSTLIGPSSKVVDNLTTPFRLIAYVPNKDKLGMVTAYKNIRRAMESATETGYTTAGDYIYATDVLGANRQMASRLQKITQAITSITGVESLERLSRYTSQAIGEYAAAAHVRDALAGSEESIRFLNQLGTDWRTVSTAELGTRIGQLAQGRYDATNLPAWMRDSYFYPMFTLSRWSIEQWNNFREFAIKPAQLYFKTRGKEGSIVPALTQILAGLTGGFGIAEIREFLDGRKQYIATFPELENAPDRERAAQELALKLGAAAQITGTMGFVGDVGQQLVETFLGKAPRGYNWPLLSFFRDSVGRMGAAARAIGDGEPLLNVISAVANDTARQQFQAYRIMDNLAGRLGISPESAERLQKQNERRDLNMYRTLSGGGKTPFFPIQSYTGLSEEKLNRATDPDEIRQRGAALAEQARANARNPQDLERRIRRAKTNPIRFAPAELEEFRRYVKYIEATQGEEKAKALIERYRRERNLQKLRSQAVR